MKKQTEILNYIRQKCLAGEKLSIRAIAKEFKTSNRHIATAEQLGYIRKTGPGLYVWKVGEVLPVMAKLMTEKISEYYKDHNKKKSVPTSNDVCEDMAPIVKELEETLTRSVEPSGACNFWENMYNDLKERHEDVLKTNKELIDISNRDDKRIYDLRSEVDRLKIDLDFVKTLDDAGNNLIDNLRSENDKLKSDNEQLKDDAKSLTKLISSDVHLIADLQAKISRLESKTKKRWDFTLFGLPIFGTYEK